MSSTTALILVGSSDPYHGGICPDRQAYLTENDRPAWTFDAMIRGDGAAPASDPVVWIPTIESILEDGILMVAIHAIRDPGIIDCARRSFGGKDLTRVELNRDISGKKLAELHEACRAWKGDAKLAVIAFEDSSIRKELKVLGGYLLDMVVCTPVYCRQSSPWSGERIVRGSLETPPRA
jgi:hypothetical protein